MTAASSLPDHVTPTGPDPGSAARSAAHRDRLLAAVEEVAEELEAEAVECEASGRLTDRALELLRETGIGWGLVTEEMGGLGMYPGDVFPVLERISRIDGAIGWIATIVASSGPLLAHLEPSVAKSLLTDGLPIFAVSGAPSGRGLPVAGGYRFSGSYSYSSAGLHADWVFCGGVIVDENGAPVPGPLLVFLVPASAVTHRGNWDTLGLRGTGSVDFTVTDEFVPAERVVALFGPSPSSSPSVAGGNTLNLHLMHLGFASGITRRLLDEIAAHATRPATRPGATSPSENPVFRREYAERELAARAARALTTDILADIDATLSRQEPVSLRQITLLFGANVHAHQTARDIASWAFAKGGGTALRAGTLQRLFRDTFTGAQHLLVDPGNLTTIGQELLDAPPQMQWAGPYLIDSGSGLG